MKRVGAICVFCLSVLVCGQITILADWWRKQTPQEWPVAGDHLTGISTWKDNPTFVDSFDERPIVLLVFNSQCPHCIEITPLWKSWLENNDHGCHVKAVTRESTQEGERFLLQQGIHVDAIPWQSLGVMHHAITSRAPWVYITDHEGRILAEGHGSRLPELSRSALDSTHSGSHL